MRSNKETLEAVRWQKTPLLSDGFICVVDVMGDDSAIVEAARVSHNGDNRDGRKRLTEALINLYPSDTSLTIDNCGTQQLEQALKKCDDDDRKLLRMLMRHWHTTPFEMAEIKFLVRVPMDTWRQWIRHRTASVNEYSTRYTEAIDAMDTTPPNRWRLQATKNKQGSAGYLTGWPDPPYGTPHGYETPGDVLSEIERQFHEGAKKVYLDRLKLGVAREQARKDLPLSNYTEAYWKCDVKNILNFLRLRMDSHAQLEIRQYANAMGKFVEQLFPETYQAFVDYQLEASVLTRLDKLVIGKITKLAFQPDLGAFHNIASEVIVDKREREECWDKCLELGLVK